MRSTHCTLHTPGHSVHYIQGRQITDFARHYPGRCDAVTVTDLGAGWFETKIDGETRLGWNHDHDLVTDVARDSVLGEVVHVPDFDALVRWVSGSGTVGNSGTSGTVLIPAWSDVRPCVAVDGGSFVYREVRDER
ncbi:MAG: hypothetical protein ACTH0G_07585 [Corynebacterium variabile]